MLQTATSLKIEHRGGSIRWSIEFLEPETLGRFHNEMLGIGYMIENVRTFAGAAWSPEAVMTTLAPGAPKAELEQTLGVNVSHGHAVTSIDLDASLLTCGKPGECRSGLALVASEPNVPRDGDVLGMTSAVVDLAQYGGYPRIDWVADKLATNRRTLQRQLKAQGTTFGRLVESALLRRAEVLLGTGMSITEIGFELGYRDHAHFTRAFRRWTGISPSAYRRAPSQAPEQKGRPLRAALLKLKRSERK
jgi:AraC-like DNA-binding protein